MEIRLEEQQGKKIIVFVTRYEERAFPKEMGARWNPDRKVWWIPLENLDRERLMQLHPFNEKLIDAILAEPKPEPPSPKFSLNDTLIQGTLYNFQKHSCQFAFDRRYAIIADEMGLGKTLTAITVAVNDLAEHPENKILVVVPAFLKRNWLNEFKKFAPQIRCAATTQSGKKLHELNYQNLDCIIVNYEQLEKVEHLFDKAEIIIADEAHYIKNVLSQRTKVFHNFISMYSPQRLLLLTGTPIKNRVPDLFSLLKLIGKNPVHGLNGEQILFKNSYAFADYFCNYRAINTRRGTMKQYTTLKPEKAPFLKQLMAEKFIRHTMEDFTDLPPISSQIVEIEEIARQKDLDAELEAAWREAQENRKGGEIATVKARAASAKSLATADLAENHLENDEPIIVFTDHVDSSVLISEKLTRAGYKTRLINGATKIEDRSAFVEEFQNGEIDCVIATIPTLGVGVTLTRAKTVIFNDLPWCPADFEQAKKRIHRIGQDQKCLVKIVAMPGIDSHIAKSLASKIEQIEQIIG